MNREMEEKGIVARDRLPPESRCPLLMHHRLGAPPGHHRRGAMAAPRSPSARCRGPIASAAGRGAPAGDNRGQQSLSPPCRGSQDVRARGGARAEQSKVKAEGTCIYCGEAGHGKTPQWRARRAECPAYGKTCRKCNRQNHLDKACLGGRSSRPAPEETDGVCDEQQATAFGELCTLTSTADMNATPVACHTPIPVAIHWQGPVADDVEEGDLAWCAAGLESLQSVTWDRVREAISSSDDMRTLEEMAADSFPESRAEMPVAIRAFHQYREDITSADGCNAAAAWSCERPGEARDGVRARSTTGTATCRLSPARDAAHPYRASGAGPGRPSYATAGLCGPYGHSPTATRCAAGDRLAPVHQEGRCACLA
ncbi:unnamed protein product [Boreogadus saida]